MKRILLATTLVAATLAAGCGGGDTPVARVEIQPRQVRLPFSQAQSVRLTWTPSAVLKEQPTVFVHLLDGEGQVVRTFDHAFPQRWREGAPISYDVKLYQSALAPPLPPGKYRLTVGLYGKDGDRWALDGLGESIARNEYVAAEVEVPSQNPNLRFLFAPTWLPVEPGGDRQVLARRWMADRATIRLVNQRAPGTIWMVVHIPETNSPDHKLVLDPGASSPSVLVAGNCGSSESNLSGPGLHEVELALVAPPPGGFCRVLLSSNFVLEPTPAAGPAARKRSVSVDNIAWIPSGSGRKGRRAKVGAAGAQEPATPAAPE
ncbi:MAG TPA: hypothetical protein VLE27_15395 [Thermoanaerobaculia bacterium]|nr:hypothetical protein [Thermoanaerobaculia bacterium]